MQKAGNATKGEESVMSQALGSKKSLITNSTVTRVETMNRKDTTTPEEHVRSCVAGGCVELRAMLVAKSARQRQT